MLMLAGVGYWYLIMRSPVPSKKINELLGCRTKESVAVVLGVPRSMNRANGLEYWRYYRDLCGIRTELYLDITFSNDTVVTWTIMD